jgi:hypothetical protein
MREGTSVTGKPSQVWTRLSELTTQKLIIGLLVFIVLTPFLHVVTTDLGPMMSLNMLDEAPVCTLQFNVTLGKLLEINTKHNYDLVYLGVKGGCCPTRTYANDVVCSVNDLKSIYTQILPDPLKEPDALLDVQRDYRTMELKVVTSDTNQTEGYYSIRTQTQAAHRMNVSTTSIQPFKRHGGSWHFLWHFVIE